MTWTRDLHTSRRRIALVTTLAATLLSATVGNAQPVALPLMSNMPGALDAPSDWNCQKIGPEYRQWLAEGNPASSWKFVGRTFRDVATGTTYDWQDWLEWADAAGCLKARQLHPGRAISTAVTALGAGIIAARMGSAAKSPG